MVVEFAEQGRLNRVAFERMTVSLSRAAHDDIAAIYAYFAERGYEHAAC